MSSKPHICRIFCLLIMMRQGKRGKGAKEGKGKGRPGKKGEKGKRGEKKRKRKNHQKRNLRKNNGKKGKKSRKRKGGKRSKMKEGKLRKGRRGPGRKNVGAKCGRSSSRAINETCVTNIMAMYAVYANQMKNFEKQLKRIQAKNKTSNNKGGEH